MSTPLPGQHAAANYVIDCSSLWSLKLKTMPVVYSVLSDTAAVSGSFNVA